MSVENNTAVLRGLFAHALCIEDTDAIDALTYQSIPEWDSISHMALIATIDNHFDIMMEPDDIIEMSSFGAAKVLLAKYGVIF